MYLKRVCLLSHLIIMGHSHVSDLRKRVRTNHIFPSFSLDPAKYGIKPMHVPVSEPGVHHVAVVRGFFGRQRKLNAKFASMDNLHEQMSDSAKWKESMSILSREVFPNNNFRQKKFVNSMEKIREAELSGQFGDASFSVEFRSAPSWFIRLSNLPK